jgi:hypothetical protein
VKQHFLMRRERSVKEALYQVPKLQTDDQSTANESNRTA